MKTLAMKRFKAMQCEARIRLLVKGLRRVLNRMDANIFINTTVTVKKKVAP